MFINKMIIVQFQRKKLRILCINLVDYLLEYNYWLGFLFSVLYLRNHMISHDFQMFRMLYFGFKCSIVFFFLFVNALK